jgi:hypothetical protein
VLLRELFGTYNRYIDENNEDFSLERLAGTINDNDAMSLLCHIAPASATEGSAVFQLH